MHTALPNIHRDGSHSSSTKELIHFFCRAFPLVSRNLSQEGSPPLLVSCSRRATPLRQAVLSAVKSFGFTLVYIPQSYLIARTFLPTEFTLSAIYGSAGARAANVPEPRSPTAACAEFPRCPHGHHCFLLGTGCGDLTPFWECHRRKSEEDHGPALGGLPDIYLSLHSCCACYAAGRAASCLSEAVSISHKSRIMCQNWAVGRSPGCSATVFVLQRARGCTRLPARARWQRNWPRPGGGDSGGRACTTHWRAGEAQFNDPLVNKYHH